MKILSGRKQWLAAAGLVIVVALAVYLFWNRGSANTKSIQPPIEASRPSAIMVRDTDLSQKARELQSPAPVVSATRGIVQVLPSIPSIPKVIKPVVAPVTVASVKTPVVQSSPVRKSYKTY